MKKSRIFLLAVILPCIAFATVALFAFKPEKTPVLKDCTWTSPLSCATKKCAQELAATFISESGTRINVTSTEYTEIHFPLQGTFWVAEVHYTTSGDCL